MTHPVEDAPSWRCVHYLGWRAAALSRERIDSLDLVRGIAIFWVQSLLVESRFMSMFAMLFGVGLAIQGDRMRAREIDPRPRLRRRLAWLLVFGLIHGFLRWRRYRSDWLRSDPC